jgi:hypothetical protein
MALAALEAWYAALCGVGSTLETEVLLTIRLGRELDVAERRSKGRKAWVTLM